MGPILAGTGKCLKRGIKGVLMGQNGQQRAHKGLKMGSQDDIWLESRSLGNRRSISFWRSFLVLRREISKSRLWVKIFSFSWSSHVRMSSMKSGGKLLTIFKRCANLDSEISSLLRAWAHVIFVGPSLMKALIFRASFMVF